MSVPELHAPITVFPMPLCATRTVIWSLLRHCGLTDESYSMGCCKPSRPIFIYSIQDTIFYNTTQLVDALLRNIARTDYHNVMRAQVIRCFSRRQCGKHSPPLWNPNCDPVQQLTQMALIRVPSQKPGKTISLINVTAIPSFSEFFAKWYQMQKPQRKVLHINCNFNKTRSADSASKDQTTVLGKRKAAPPAVEQRVCTFHGETVINLHMLFAHLFSEGVNSTSKLQSFTNWVARNRTPKDASEKIIQPVFFGVHPKRRSIRLRDLPLLREYIERGRCKWGITWAVIECYVAEYS